jgi:hypothetical protein
MTLRFRGADSRNGLTFEETAFYQAETETKKWVHVGCNPCYWSREQGRLMGMPTEWGSKISCEFEEDNDRDMEDFLERKGYPQEKWMKDRITRCVTRFQAIWRGHRCKRKLKIVLLSHEIDIIEQRTRARYALYQEMRRNTPDVGDHVEILFNKGESSEAIYSGEVIEIQYRGEADIKIKVKYHYDGEVRKYTGKKFKLLKKECEEHKMKLGIEAKLAGRIHTARIGRMIAVPLGQTRPSIQDWRYHYPDGGVVE